VPEILVAVSFLSTRIQNATDSDWSKLIRILKYLNNDLLDRYSSIKGHESISNKLLITFETSGNNIIVLFCTFDGILVLNLIVAETSSAL
jgi:hypothetical protein